jgi:hypothetical protein
MIKLVKLIIKSTVVDFGSECVNNSRTDVDDEQWPGLRSMPATVSTRADAVVGEDRCIKLIEMTQERSILLSSVHRVVYNQQDYWQPCACHAPKYLTVPKLIVYLADMYSVLLCSRRVSKSEYSSQLESLCYFIFWSAFLYISLNFWSILVWYYVIMIQKHLSSYCTYFF